MIFGFPNKNSYPGFKEKLNWVFCGDMQKFRINTLTIPLCEISARFIILEPLYLSFINWRIRKFILNLSENNINNFNFSNVKGQIIKDIRFFEYKLRNKTCFFLRYKDFSLLIKVKNHLHIGIVGYFDKLRINEFINAVKSLSRKLGCGQINLILSENHWLYEYLINEFKPSTGLPIGFHLFNEEINPDEIQFTAADFDTF